MPKWNYTAIPQSKQLEQRSINQIGQLRKLFFLKPLLFVNGTKVAEGKIKNTIPMLIFADETADVGIDYHTPVTPDYAQHGNDFTGKIESVTIELK